MSKRKSWRERLFGSRTSKAKKLSQEALTKESIQNWGAGSYVVPPPAKADPLMSKVPKGNLSTINAIRQSLAKKHKTAMDPATSPLNAGASPGALGASGWGSAQRFDARSADAGSADARREGALRGTPFWRTLKAGSEINPKYPGGIDSLQSLREGEGHKVVRRGKNFAVQDYENSLFDFND